MKTALYFNSNGSHLARGMVHNCIVFGSRGYKLKKNERALALEKLEDGTLIGCIVKGTGKISIHYKKVWPCWKPFNASKVVCNRVSFQTKLHKVPEILVGKLSQAGISKSNQKTCFRYLKMLG